MRRTTLKKIFSLLFILNSLLLSAQDFKVDGIYYNIISAEDKTVEVTHHKDALSKPDKRYRGAVTIPSTVTRKKKSYNVVGIGDSAFEGCSEVTSVVVSEGVINIDNNAFSNCSALTDIRIPASVKEIGETAFGGCLSLDAVYIDNLSAWCNIDFALLGSPLLQTVNLYLKDKILTEVVIPDDITEIADFAFYGCSSITSIVVPEGVTSIGTDAFSHCTGLVSIVIPEGVQLSSGAIKGCDNLKTIQCGDKILTPEDIDAKSGEVVYQVVEQLPEFPGGMSALMNYLRDNMNYPEVCKKNKIQGKTYVHFIVGSDGVIRDVEVQRSSGDVYLDKEAVRVVKSMPKWNPGRQDGKAVAVEFTLPIIFRLK